MSYSTPKSTNGDKEDDKSKKPHVFVYTIGCKHSKVDQESAPVYESHDFLGQTPISGGKMLFKIFIF
jgi:hypothetical protein